ncbi:MAG: NAD(P)-dependent glycerol-3-phosphate dehydrogenase [Phycisphaerales bacterium]|nr:NAD(P)-dependent glycerol-3-phosphate dehydrogenase [Phycisphaerales bacterium]
MRHVAVLGSGQMGLVCTAMLASATPNSGSAEPASVAEPPEIGRIAIWGHELDAQHRLAQVRHSPLLEGFSLPDRVAVALTDEQAVQDAGLIVCAIPCQHIREAFTRLKPHIQSGVPVVSTAKGLEQGSLLRPTEVIAQVLDGDAGSRPLAALSGPTIAAELARGLPATMIAASENAQFASAVQHWFAASYLRIYTSPDLVGTELAGAIKNVIAIAAGILDGLQAGYNAKSALLARGLAEIVRLGVAMGAQPETFFGVAGVGDLATTCFSPEGRNRACGEALGRGRTLEQHMGDSMHVVEGVATTKAVMELAQTHGVEMPICQAVHAVLFDGLDPVDAIGLLMSRPQKEERLA